MITKKPIRNTRTQIESFFLQKKGILKSFFIQTQINSDLIYIAKPINTHMVKILNIC